MLASNERRVGKNAVQDQQYSPAVEINLGTGSRKVRARLKASQGKTEYSEIKHIGSDMCSDCMDEDRNEWTSISPHLTVNIYRYECVNLPTNLSVRSHMIYTLSFVLSDPLLKERENIAFRGLQSLITR